MSHLLCSMLGLKKRQQLFSQGIKILEKSSASKGIDTRLIADIISTSNQIIRQLKLDTKDTTGEELYYTLLSLAGQDNAKEMLESATYILKIYDGKMISFNYLDIKQNAKERLSYAKQISSRAQKKLGQEIISRYKDKTSLTNNDFNEVLKMMGLTV